MNYEQLMKMFDNSPTKAAFAFGLWRENSSTKTKRKACARVCNWKRMPIPKKMQEKLAKISSALP